jgi:Cof subfamily protein (haloacid dehalogenase superfamily)
MSFQIVALDIDGTLLDSQGQLPPENVEAVRKTVERGIKIILVTGRRFSTAKRVAETLELDNPLVTHNGALIRFPFLEERLASWFLAPEIASVVLNSTPDFLAYAVLHSDKSPIGQLTVHPLSRNNLSLRSYLDKLPQAVQEVDSLNSLLDADLIQIMFSGELEAIRRIEESLIGLGLAGMVRMSRTYYPSRNIGIIDILDKGCSKGNALSYLARYYGCPPERILAIGDNHNDLEMLKFAGTGVVVSNCVEELKSHGFKETSSNDELGVARALEQYVW